MSSTSLPVQALNRAMLEAVDFVHGEGWDAPPTLFALVPSELLAEQLGYIPDEDDENAAPLTLVVQELPEHILPGSDELGDYLSRIAWPEEIAGVVLAQEIRFRDSSLSDSLDDVPARPARLFSGVLRDDPDAELTLLQMRPTDEEIAQAGPFAEDKVELRGGPDVAPGVIAALRVGLERDPEEL